MASLYGSSSILGKGFDQGGTIPGDSPGYDNMLGMLPGGSAVGLEGGEGVVKPEAMQNPAIADLVAGANKHYDEGGTVTGGATPPPPSSSSSGSSGSPGSSSQPGGQTNSGDPVIGGPPQGETPSKSGSPAGETAPPADGTQEPKGQEKPGQVGDPHGTGSGFGISGGLIGSAESAAEAAIPFGGGAAAAPLVQEANKAIGFAGQLASIFAFEMPIDTLGLDDSPQGNPMNSWYGKLGAGLVGGHNDTPNVAGKTQSPLSGGNEPGQPADPAQPVSGGASPLGGQQQQGQGPMIHIENQNNASDVDHDSNNRGLVNQMNAYSAGPG